MGQRVRIIGPGGQSGTVDSEEIAASGGLPQGWQINAHPGAMMMGHVPGAVNPDAFKPPPEEQAMSGTIGFNRGLYGPLSKYLSAGAGAAGVGGGFPMMGDWNKGAPSPTELFDAAGKYENKAVADNPKTALTGEGLGVASSFAPGAMAGSAARQGARGALEKAVAPEVEKRLPLAVTDKLREMIPQLEKMEKIAPGSGNKLATEAMPRIAESVRPQITDKMLSLGQAAKDVLPAVGAVGGGAIGGSAMPWYGHVMGSEMGAQAMGMLTGAKLPRLFSPLAAARTAATSPAAWNQITKALPAAGGTINAAPGAAQMLSDFFSYGGEKP